MLNADIVIVGAGPIGLEAAVCAKRHGLSALILEAGTEIAAHVRSWGHVELFTPFEMNSSEETRSHLQQAGVAIPEPSAMLKGADYVEQYLNPIAKHLLDEEQVLLGRKVKHIVRGNLLKTEQIGTEERAKTRFRTIAFDAQGNRTEVESRFVFDCSGVLGQPNRLGMGGVPCVGELEHAADMHRHLPDFCGLHQQQFAGRRVAVVGAGYSAATAVLDLLVLARNSPAKIVWITRSDSALPMTPIENDALPERHRLTLMANQAVAEGVVEFYPHSQLQQIDFQNRQWSLHLEGKNDPIVVDEFVGLTGYRPDRSLYEELHVHECYATHGPIKLAASLMSANSADCMSQPVAGVDLLKTPETGFYLLGSKSYGRNPQFLLQHGLQHVAEVMTECVSQSEVSAS